MFHINFLKSPYTVKNIPYGKPPLPTSAITASHQASPYRCPMYLWQGEIAQCMFW